MGKINFKTTLYKCQDTKPPSLDSEPPSCTKHHPVSNFSLTIDSPKRTTNSWPTSLNTVNPTEPLLNSCSERKSSPQDTPRSRPSTPMPTTPTLLVTTSSPTKPSPR